jgi:hypothetical protein
MAVTIVGHVAQSLLLDDLSVRFGNHLACNPLILYMRVAIRKTLTLRRNLFDGHFNFPSALDQFLEVFWHRVLSRFNGDVI